MCLYRQVGLGATQLPWFHDTQSCVPSGSFDGNFGADVHGFLGWPSVGRVRLEGLVYRIGSCGLALGIGSMVSLVAVGGHDP